MNPLPLDEDRAAGGEDVCGIVARRLMGGFVWLLVRFVDPPLAWVKRETMLDPDQGLSWNGGSDVLTAFETEHGMVTADRYKFGAERGSVTFAPREWDRGLDRHAYSYATLSEAGQWDRSSLRPKQVKQRLRGKKKKAQTAPGGGEAGAAAQSASS